MHPQIDAPRWMSRALLLAAAIDVLGGVYLMANPTGLLTGAGGAEPAYPVAWQGVGGFTAVLGLGLALAARDPFANRVLVFTALAAKALIPAGFLWAASQGALPWALGILVLAHGPIWWLPFAGILRGEAQARRATQTPPALPVDMALSLYQDEVGTDLLEASRKQPQFLVFLRHFGCTFCREALADLAAINERLSSAGTRLVLVHMSTDTEASELFAKYGLNGVVGISDPERVLYRAFALRRGSPTQLLGWSVWKRGWEAGVKQGHGVGWLRGDAAQMPGAFVVSGGHVVAQFIHESASDRPDYVVIADDGVDAAEFQQDLEREGVGFGFQDRLRSALAAKASSQA